MSKLFATLKSKLLCALALVFAACLTLGLSFSLPAHAEENLIKEYNLTLSNDLSVNFYANEAVGENAYVTASVEGIDGEKTICANADNAYKFTVTDLAPQLMSREITVKLYNAAKELKGNAEITLASYCKKLLDGGAAGNNMGEKEFKALSTLVVDLLNYGAAAQEYLGDTTYEKSNAFLTGEAYNSFVGGEYTMPAASAFTATVADEGTKASVKPTTAKLYLDYNVVAKIAFEVKDVAVDGVKAFVGGNVVTATVSSEETKTAGVTTYTASVPLSVLDIEKEVSVTLLSGGKEVGYTVKGSVSGYLSTRATNTEATDKTLAAKLYSYAKSAAATLVTPSYTVTLAAGATGGTLTFADGKTTADVTVGEALPALAEVNNFLGFMNEDGTIYSADTFKMPSENVTLTPVINTDEYVTTGDGKLDYGRQKEDASNINRYLVQNYGGSGSIPEAGNPIVIENEDGEKQLGQLFTKIKTNGTTTDKNGDFRIYAPYPRTAAMVGIKYSFTVVHKNYGNEPLDFEIYMRGNGDDTSDIESFNVKLDNKGDVQTTTVMWTVNQTHPYEVLFHYKFNTAVSSGSLGAYAYIELATPKYTATVNGGTFADGTSEKQFKQGAVIEGITFEKGTPYAISMTSADGTVTCDKYGEAKMPGYDVTITPIYYNPVISGDGDIDWGAGSYQTQWTPAAAVSFANNKYVVKNNKLGTIYNVTGAENSQFRLMTTYYPLSGTEYTMTYTFANLGETDIAFTCYQVNSGNTLTNFKQEIRIKAGESVTVAITFKFTGGTIYKGQTCANANVMCFFVLGTGFENGSQLFVSSSIVQS